jgi:hypothetical protein
VLVVTCLGHSRCFTRPRIGEVTDAYRVLSIQCPSFEDALNRFHPIQVGAADRRIEGHNAVGKEPEHNVDGVMPSEIVEHEEHPEWRQFLGERDPHREPFLPPRPPVSVLLGVQLQRCGKRRQNAGQFGLDPRMENGIGRTGHPLDPYGSTRRVKERPDADTTMHDGKGRKPTTKPPLTDIICAWTAKTTAGKASGDIRQSRPHLP